MQKLRYDTQSFSKYVVFSTYIYIATNIAFDLISLWENAQIRTIIDPAVPYIDAVILEEQLNKVLLYTSIGFLIILAATIVINSIWIYRASKNAAIMDPSSERIRPGWAVGWFAIPIANLWKPLEAMKQTWQSSNTPPLPFEAAVPTSLLACWMLWIGSTILTRGLIRIQNKTEDIQAYMDYNIYLIFPTVLVSIAGFLFIKFIREVSSLQSDWDGQRIEQT